MLQFICGFFVRKEKTSFVKATIVTVPTNTTYLSFKKYLIKLQCIYDIMIIKVKHKIGKMVFNLMFP